MEATFCLLRVNRAGGHIHLRADHFETCLIEAYPEKEANPPPPKQIYKCMKLVELVQFVW